MKKLSIITLFSLVSIASFGQIAETKFLGSGKGLVVDRYTGSEVWNQPTDRKGLVVDRYAGGEVWNQPLRMACNNTEVENSLNTYVIEDVETGKRFYSVSNETYSSLEAVTYNENKGNPNVLIQQTSGCPNGLLVMQSVVSSMGVNSLVNDLVEVSKLP